MAIQKAVQSDRWKNPAAATTVILQPLQSTVHTGLDVISFIM